MFYRWLCMFWKLIYLTLILLHTIHSKLFWPKSKILTSKSVKYRNLQNFVTDIFKVKNGWSPEHMHDIFKFIESPYSLRINSLFEPEDPNVKIWHRNRKISHIIFFPNKCKAILYRVDFKAKLKTLVPENCPWGLCKTYILPHDNS